MRKAIVLNIVLIFLAALIGSSSIYAHPGRMDANGCHYCRTNCDKWGVAWDERHCHGGGGSSTESTVQSAPAVQGQSISNPPIAIPSRKPTSTPIQGYFKVSSIIDGDTIRVIINGKSEKVRLLGIDSPESSDPRKSVQCFAKEATNKLKNLINGKTVKLVIDKTQSDKDKYGRLLRFIYLNGKDIDAEMIKEGFAFSYKQYPTTKLNEYNKLEKLAREQNKGLWGNCPKKIESKVM